ncbi:MAG: amidase family protein [Candidatus Woesearchaeota archaeon]
MKDDEIASLDEEYKFLSKRCDVNDPRKKGILSPYTFSLKDAIWLKGVETTASSDILEGFCPVENSTVAQKILENGGRIIGKTTQDAFGFGTFCTNVGSRYRVPLNPSDKERCVGGSSGGAACAAKLIDKHIAIGESTGGSITTPASFSGVVGVCPTYGRVSRHGLITYSSSFDKIGVMSRNVADSAVALGIISGMDEKDETSSDIPVSDYVAATDDFSAKTKGMKVGILDFEGVDEAISQRVGLISERLEEKGVEIEKIDLPFTKKYSLSAYYIIAMAEASTHLACLSGLRYGKGDDVSKEYNEYFTDVRTGGFTKEAKRRIMIGTYVRMAGYRGKYYEKALKVRQKIIDEYKDLFSRFDAILCPAAPCVAPKFDEIDHMSLSQVYSMDSITAGPNMAGLPNISVPVSKSDELPFGAMLIADYFQEAKLMSLGSLLEVLR